MGISTHILDTTKGKPAQNVAVVLERETEQGWLKITSAHTDADGRVKSLLTPGENPMAGTWRLTFDTGGYSAAQGTQGFYPSVTITFVVREPTEHHHVPLLLNPYGFATYRGS